MKLREVTDNDHEWLVELHNDPVVLKNLTNPNPITLQSHLAWWNSIKDNNTEKRLIFENNNEKIGFTKFYKIDAVNKNCMLGADIHKSHRGKGFAKPMWALMLNKCFYELSLYRVSLTTASFNTVAQNVYSDLGFLTEGRRVKELLRDDNYYDCICMYMLRDMWNDAWSKK